MVKMPEYNESVIRELLSRPTRRQFIGGLAGIVLASQIPRRAFADGEDYFPLQVGNFWEYDTEEQTRTFTITGTTDIDGKTYYVFDEYFFLENPISGLFRYDTENGLILEHIDGREEIRYKLDALEGESWDYLAPNSEYPHRVTLENRNETITTPARTFNDCLKFVSIYTGAVIPENTRNYTEWLAPNVGLVKFEFSMWMVPYSFQLQSAYVNGISIPGQFPASSPLATTLLVTGLAGIGVYEVYRRRLQEQKET